MKDSTFSSSDIPEVAVGGKSHPSILLLLTTICEVTPKHLPASHVHLSLPVCESDISGLILVLSDWWNCSKIRETASPVRLDKSDTSHELPKFHVKI